MQGHASAGANIAPRLNAVHSTRPLLVRQSDIKELFTDSFHEGSPTFTNKARHKGTSVPAKRVAVLRPSRLG